MTSRTSMYGVLNQMPLKRLQTTDTYILTCYSSSTVSPTHVPPCTVEEKTAAGEGSDSKCETFQAVKIVFFVKAKGKPQISFAEHCGSGRKGASNSSKLKQVKKTKQDGYSPFLSHPSQALRLLQLSPCIKQLAL